MTRATNQNKYTPENELPVRSAKLDIGKVESLTNQKVVDIEPRKNWIVCILESGLKFSFRKW